MAAARVAVLGGAFGEAAAIALPVAAGFVAATGGADAAGAIGVGERIVGGTAGGDGRALAACGAGLTAAGVELGAGDGAVGRTALPVDGFAAVAALGGVDTAGVVGPPSGGLAGAVVSAVRDVGGAAANADLEASAMGGAAVSLGADAVADWRGIAIVDCVMKAAGFAAAGGAAIAAAAVEAIVPSTSRANAVSGDSAVPIGAGRDAMLPATAAFTLIAVGVAMVVASAVWDKPRVLSCVRGESEQIAGHTRCAPARGRHRPCVAVARQILPGQRCRP